MPIVESPVILAFVVAYLAACAVIGVWAMRRTKTIADFLIAGQSLGPFVGGIATMSSRVTCPHTPQHVSDPSPHWPGPSHWALVPLLLDELLVVPLLVVPLLPAELVVPPPVPPPPVPFELNTTSPLEKMTRPPYDSTTDRSRRNLGSLLVAYSRPLT